jgi:hypothetical protein
MARDTGWCMVRILGLLAILSIAPIAAAAADSPGQPPPRLPAPPPMVLSSQVPKRPLSLTCRPAFGAGAALLPRPSRSFTACRGTSGLRCA